MADRGSGGFGAKLREARERRGLTLRQIADATKISVVALEALERNDIRRLPGGIFSRAFVRAYAIEVGLDPEVSIRDFIAQFPTDSVTAGHTSAPVEDNVAIEGDRQTASAYLWMALVSVPIVGALLYFGVVGWQSAGSAPREDQEQASTVRPEPAPGGAATDTAAVLDVPPVVAPDLAAPPIEALAVPAAAVVPDDRLAVGLSVIAPCRVVAIVDGKRTIDRQLVVGERQQLDVRRDLVLTVSDPAALVVMLNGVEARPFGSAGETVTTRLTLANFKDYLTPR